MLVHARTHAPIQSTIPINNMHELIIKQGMKLTGDIPWLFLQRNWHFLVSFLQIQSVVIATQMGAQNLPLASRTDIVFPRHVCDKCLQLYAVNCKTWKLRTAKTPRTGLHNQQPHLWSLQQQTGLSRAANFHVRAQHALRLVESWAAKPIAIDRSPNVDPLLPTYTYHNTYLFGSTFETDS